MNEKFIITIFVILFSITTSIAQTKTEALDNMIEVGMKDYHIPGLIAAIYYKDQIVFKKAYGLKNVEQKEKVDNNTVFNLGSSTKSVICMAIGILVDEGKL